MYLISIYKQLCCKHIPGGAVERDARLPLVLRQCAGREAVAARMEVAVLTQREEAPPVVRHNGVANRALCFRFGPYFTILY